MQSQNGTPLTTAKALHFLLFIMCVCGTERESNWRKNEKKKGPLIDPWIEVDFFFFSLFRRCHVSPRTDFPHHSQHTLCCCYFYCTTFLELKSRAQPSHFHLFLFDWFHIDGSSTLLVYFSKLSKKNHGRNIPSQSSNRWTVFSPSVARSISSIQSFLLKERGVLSRCFSLILLFCEFSDSVRTFISTSLW